MKSYFFFFCLRKLIIFIFVLNKNNVYSSESDNNINDIIQQWQPAIDNGTNKIECFYYPRFPFDNRTNLTTLCFKCCSDISKTKENACCPDYLSFVVVAAIFGPLIILLITCFLYLYCEYAKTLMKGPRLFNCCRKKKDSKSESVEGDELNFTIYDYIFFYATSNQDEDDLDSKLDIMAKRRLKPIDYSLYDRSRVFTNNSFSKTRDLNRMEQKMKDENGITSLIPNEQIVNFTLNETNEIYSYNTYGDNY